MSFATRTSPSDPAARQRSTPRYVVGIAVVISAIVFASTVLNFPASKAASGQQTQMQLYKEACEEYKKADVEMNQSYGLIMRNYRGNRAFVSAMRRAQLAWIRYRNAHLDSIFPGNPSQYGSVNPMCRCSNLAEITKARTQILNRWVEGIEEGDVCAGSVKGSNE